MRAHEYRTKHIVAWCEEHGIDDLNDLTGRHLHQLRLWHMEEHDSNQVSLRQHMCTLRDFLKWADSSEAVPPDLYDKVMVPKVGHEEQRSDAMLEADEAGDILEYLTTYHFASRRHALLALLGDRHSHRRRVLDRSRRRVSRGRVRRPRSSARPRDDAKERQERRAPGAITDDLAVVLAEYIEHDRVDRVDDDGREPLFTSDQGRLSCTSLRRSVYQSTPPCFRGEPCPDCIDNPDKL